MTEGPMTKQERDDLARLVRRREKLAKADVDTIAAEREADFEAQLARRYDLYTEAWRDASERLEHAVEELNQRIRAEFEEKGIPLEFAPSARAAWFSRGENLTADRRFELRKVAKTRLAAEAKQAKARIERASVEIQTQLVAAGLQTEEARAYLDQMPTADELLPTLDLSAIEQRYAIEAVR
jgi:hypothetical protein